MKLARALLAHPLTRGVDLDDPRTTLLRRQIIRQKTFLRKIYEEWYDQIAATLPPGNAPVLELGSGGGFLREHVRGVITSDVVSVPGVDTVLDGTALPFENHSLRAIVMVDVLHHLNEPRRFFTEAARCLRQTGAIVMIEPWVSPWSRVVYSHLHHEPFAPEAGEWEFTGSGPLSAANGALPWILFQRDRAKFLREFPQFAIHEIQLGMPFRYLLSGGVSLRTLMPGWSFGICRQTERTLQPWMNKLAMFARIKLVRR